MTLIGFCLSGEEHGAPDLVRFAVAAEDAGFGDLVISDHFHPWVDEQGNSPFVWSVLGGIAATTGLRIGTGVTCPIMRIHPAIIAHAAATTASMCGGGFFLGVGSGENLNEHVLGDRWPSVDERLAMLEEAIEIIRLLWQGETSSFDGDYYTVDDARIYSLPESPPPIFVSGLGPKATELAARVGDGYVNTAPDADLVKRYRAGGGTGPTLALAKVCWHADAAEARRLMHRVWPTSGLPGELAQELKTPALFEQASQLVTEEHAVGSKPCGPDPEPYIRSVQSYVDAGFDEVYVQQVGPDQLGFLDFWFEQVAPHLDRSP
ncbi:MAG: TIGR03557 family F420-dependent LLM class oxidoreductase [Acidobacteria bacterium]|nr:TIGR03557 family F420-dependent LLM class oxidoreductase [Acidobacteriota bacterium]